MLKLVLSFTLLSIRSLILRVKLKVKAKQTNVHQSNP